MEPTALSQRESLPNNGELSLRDGFCSLEEATEHDARTTHIRRALDEFSADEQGKQRQELNALCNIVATVGLQMSQRDISILADRPCSLGNRGHEMRASLANIGYHL